MGAVLILYRNIQGKLIMRITFKDGSKLDREIIKSTQGGKTKHKDNN
jgi:hypothetical protein